MTLPFEDLPTAAVHQDLPDEVDAFDEFWAHYPRKIGKKDARKAIKKALGRAGLGAILQGIAQYIRNKPAYADWMHPTTFLNGDHWEDEYGTAGKSTAPPTDLALQQRASHVKASWYTLGSYDREDLQELIEAGYLEPSDLEGKV